MHDAHRQPVLITGGTGFAGQHLVRQLLAHGYQQLHVTHFGTRPVPEVCTQPQVTIHQVNLTDATAVAALIQKLQPLQVYHLASFAAVGKSFEQAEMILNNNITLQITLLNSIRQHAPSARILIIGSAEEYGRLPASLAGKNITEDFPLNPINPYAVSKVTQDLLAQAYFFSYKLQIIRARPFNHIGPGQSPDFVVPAFASQIVAIERGKQQKLMVGKLTAVRDFTDVTDMVAAYMTLMESGQVGEVYNIGQGRGWQIQEILDMLCALSQTPITVEVDPSRLRPSDVEYFVADLSKITQLGWKPKVPIETTLQSILAEWRNAS